MILDLRTIRRMTDVELAATLADEPDMIVAIRIKVELDRRAAARPKNLRMEMETPNGDAASAP